ncbi:trichome birefringence-like protein 3 [Tanacetum coccineum]
MDKSLRGEESIQSILDSFNSKMQNMGCDNMSCDNSDLNMVHDVTSTLLAAGVSQQDVDAQGDPNVHGTNVTGTKLFALVLTTESTKPKVNFRALYNEEKVEDIDFVLPVENVLAARNKFANSLMGFFVGKSVAFLLVQNYIHKIPAVAYSEDGLSLIASQIGKPIMLDAFTSSMCSDPWGRMGFARAMIEVSAENELKKEVTMVVPNVDGEGHTKQIMPLEFEWKPPQCCECHVFGHSISSCPKRVVVNNAEKIVENDDSFTVVTHKKNKGKKVTNNNDANNGFKLPKPKPKVWGKKNVIQSVKPKENQVPVSLKNTFSALNDLDDPVALKEMGESSNTINNTSLQTNKEVNMDDSDSDIEEMIMEQRPKGASTPSNKSHVDINALSTVCSKVFRDWDWTSNANLCNKGCRIIVGWDVQVVDLLVLAQTDQVLHTKDLDLHKNMVRGQPWVLMGDFNAALNLEDIFSGSSVMNASMIEFKDCVANIEVVDINASGLHYTWNQKPRGGKGILKKLDRCMGNMEFIDEYVGAYAIYGTY